jgi:hypothetical protein
LEKFQPGEEVYVRLAFQAVVPIQDGHLVFVHEEDENEHIIMGFGLEEGSSLKPAILTTLDFSKLLEKGTKPGVYALDKINFQTFGGDSRDYRGDIGTPKFEVIPEHEFAPMVEEVSIYTASKWRWMKRDEEESG